LLICVCVEYTDEVQFIYIYMCQWHDSQTGLVWHVVNYLPSIVDIDPQKKVGGPVRDPKGQRGVGIGFLGREQRSPNSNYCMR